MADETTVLKAENIRISFANGFTAVNGISFSILQGKTLAIVGESGSGKSLTALALMGLLPKGASLSGEIQLSTNTQQYELNNIDSKTWQELRGRETAMVFQEPMSSLNPIMKVGKQLAECILTHRQVTKSEAKQLAIDWLGKAQLPEPAKIYEHYPHELSGGQKQRVMIAMAMCNHPVLLIADEPTTALDVTVQQEIIKLMSYLQQEHNTAMIFITHDLALAATIADDVLVMYRGNMAEYGNVARVLKMPKDLYTKALLASKPDPTHKGMQLPTVGDFIDAAERNEVVAIKPQAESRISDETLLKVQDLNIWFTEESNALGKPVKYFKAVNGVSFEIRKGEVLGLVGESGCGKSTLSKSLIGMLPVHSGQILFKHKDLATMPSSEWRSVRKQIQMIFQDPYSSLNPRMMIGDMLEEPLRVHHIVPIRELQKEVRRLLDLVQLPADALKRYPHQFSGGQRQRIGIARALALRPELLICDESVSALDVSVQAQILNLLKELQYEFQLTYLFISHDLSVVHYIRDRVMVMQAGKIVESGDAEQVLKHPKDAYTQKLIYSMPAL
ncbi:MAG: ABC transporter ATP-binding protein [Flavipsychrobacter sp.]